MWGRGVVKIIKRSRGGAQLILLLRTVVHYIIISPFITQSLRHEKGETYARFLGKVYRLSDLGFCDFPGKMDKAFYLRPKKNCSGFDNVPVGINTFSQILPNTMCSVAGIKKKTAHFLRVTCVTTLFNAGVDEKLIREPTGHRSNDL